jgi:hypothetical protein
MANFCAPALSPPDDSTSDAARRVRAALAVVLNRDGRTCTRCGQESRRVVALMADPLTTDDLAVVCSGCDERGGSFGEYPGRAA